MRKLPYILLATCVIFATIIFAGLSVQSATPKIRWSTVAPSPIARHEANGALVDGKLYVFGGYTNDGKLIPNRRSDVYNPVNNTWTRIADMPYKGPSAGTQVGATHAGTQVVGKDIYLAGGYTGPGGALNQIFASRDVWRYDTVTNQWLAMPPLPEARGAGALAELNGKLHFFGGVDINRRDRAEHWVLSLNAINQGWSSAAPLPTLRNHLGRAVLNGKIYAIGGQKGNNDQKNQLANVDVWDPALNRWTAARSMPKPRSHISGATFVMDNKWIVVAGGLTNKILNFGSTLANVTRYDPQSNSWLELTPLPRAVNSGIARSIGNQIFYATGSLSATTYKGVFTTSAEDNP